MESSTTSVKGELSIMSWLILLNSSNINLSNSKEYKSCNFLASTKPSKTVIPKENTSDFYLSYLKSDTYLTKLLNIIGHIYRFLKLSIFLFWHSIEEQSSTRRSKRTYFYISLSKYIYFNLISPW